MIVRHPRLCISRLRMTVCSCSYQHRRYAAAAAVAHAPSYEQMAAPVPPVQRYHPKQPPSHKPPELRKSQLHRQYTSLLRSTPLMLLFQHNNLKSSEWIAIRRELNIALRQVSAAHPPSSPDEVDLADSIKLQVIQTGMFATALRIVEFYDPVATSTSPSPSADSVNSDAHIPPASTLHDPTTHTHTHSLSRKAYHISIGGANRKRSRKLQTTLHALLSGPLALVTFPCVSPAHVAATLRILAPTPGSSSAFAAPRRRAAPGYYEPGVQHGVQKLLLLGARVEGRVMDGGDVRWMGGIQGGLGGVRAQLVQALQGVGQGVVGALDGASRSVYFTVEGRRMDMEEKETETEKGNREEKPSSDAAVQ